MNPPQNADERWSSQPNDDHALLGINMHFVHYAYTVLGEVVRKMTLKTIDFVYYKIAISISASERTKGCIESSHYWCSKRI